jgi:hypothetical protein
MKNNCIGLNFLFRHDDRVLTIVNIVIAAALVIDIALGSLSDITKLSSNKPHNKRPEKGINILWSLTI